MVFFVVSESAYVVWFIRDTIKSITISSTAIKRRPALPITPASAPQVLSPKRLCATSQYQATTPAIISILPHLVSNLVPDSAALTINTHQQNQLHQHHLHHQQQQQQQHQLHQHLLAKTPISTAVAIAQAQLNSTATSISPNLPPNTLTLASTNPSVAVSTSPTTVMDSAMGQLTPMANNALVLSQSMDSVNTASNEEEVSSKNHIIYHIIVNQTPERLRTVSARAVLFGAINPHELWKSTSPNISIIKTFLCLGKKRSFGGL